MIPQQLEDILNMLQDCIDAEALMYNEVSTYNQIHGTYYDEQTIVDEYRQKNGIRSFTEEQYREVNDAVYLGEEEDTVKTRSVAEHM